MTPRCGQYLSYAESHIIRAAFSSPEPLGLICNLVSRPRDQETTGSGEGNVRAVAAVS